MKRLVLIVRGSRTLLPLLSRSSVCSDCLSAARCSAFETRYDFTEGEMSLHRLKRQSLRKEQIKPVHKLTCWGDPPPALLLLFLLFKGYLQSDNDLALILSLENTVGS